MFFHTLLSALPTHAHTTEAFCAFCVSSASWARSGFLQCHSEKGGEQGQSCLSAGHPGKPVAFSWHLLLATSRGGPWAGWTTQGHCCKPHPQLQQGETVPKYVPPIPLESGKHWKSITRLEGDTRLILILITTCIHWSGMRESVRDRTMGWMQETGDL